mmetsp:Transcript_2978/g.4849  ORF Transcript_2978/g.4849 Transcript_2978/m.4849 type:complete len:178 (-) Transcript_2978:103-636(-)|eukprot:CAMPEP_0119013070 /NCGR_PEP_ID=MMETSP1176-20130426/7871_1 /TAXON_ID=265551 /ORGANISM="Synedropsis recta cf, Strain CCMP1620" /LENGTH=177 /DNA_ID=CAMNT_0006966121 /DNA_START=62 /DNA_END=595 /DNA_ORIENTATION=+
MSEVTSKGKKEEEKPKKVYKERKRYPPMADMLAYGAPEDQGKPKTFLDMVAGPAILAFLFLISLVIFLNAPIENSNGRPTFGMNQKIPRKTKPPVEVPATLVTDPIKMEPVEVKPEPVPVNAVEEEPEPVEEEQESESAREEQEPEPVKDEPEAVKVDQGPDPVKEEQAPSESAGEL